MWQKVPILVTFESHLCYLQVMWVSWLHLVVVSSTHWSGFQQSMKRQERESQLQGGGHGS